MKTICQKVFALTLVCLAIVCTAVSPVRAGKLELGNLRYMMSGEANINYKRIMYSTDYRGVGGNLPARQDSTWLNGVNLYGINAYLVASTDITDRLAVRLGVFGGVMFSVNPENGERIPVPTRGGASGLQMAYTTYKFGNLETNPLSLSIGYFPYTYAAENQEFGDYLFKTGTYPGFIVSGEQDGVHGARLAGLHLNFKGPEILQNDLFITTEVDYEPLYDISLSYVGQVDLGGFAKISAGIKLDRLIAIHDSKTSPEHHGNPWDSLRNAGVPGGFGGEQSLIYPVGYLAPNGDTLFYSKAGVKVSARASFDLKHFIKSQALGKNDLRLYAEGAILGLKNYEGYYEKIGERIPVMLGFNLPTFKAFDLLNVEFQYYGSPYRNDPQSNGSPIPFLSYAYNNPIIEDPHNLPSDKGEKDAIRWAVTLQKSFAKSFLLEIQAASDHLRINDEERLHGPREWHLGGEISFTF